MTIEIDFDVYKALTLLRPSESVSYNDVLRQLLKLESEPIESKPVVSPPKEKKPIEALCGDWTISKVTFPEGTLFRAKYKGRICEGTVKDGALVIDGISYYSPSGAAIGVTGTSLNGWQFWECKFPGKYRWVSLSTLREP